MMTSLEQEVLKIAEHNMPEIAKQLERIADGIEAFNSILWEQVKKG